MTVAGVICPQFGSKDSANRRQNKIKVQKLLFFLLRCSLSYLKITCKSRATPKSHEPYFSNILAPKPLGVFWY